MSTPTPRALRAALVEGGGPNGDDTAVRLLDANPSLASDPLLVCVAAENGRIRAMMRLLELEVPINTADMVREAA
jgi:hypothetical protein